MDLYKSETKERVKLLEEKIALLETIIQEQKSQTFSIIPVWIEDRYKFFDINCKEIMIGLNPNAGSCFSLTTKDREIKLYFDNMAFDSLSNLYLNCKFCDTGSFSERTHLDAFISQFKSCNRLRLNFGIYLSYPDQYHNKTELIKFIVKIIGNIVCNNNQLEIIITGCNSFLENGEERLYTYILQELLKFKNYKKIHFDVEYTKDHNSTKLFVSVEDTIMTTFKQHCETNGIEYVSNIIL